MSMPSMNDGAPAAAPQQPGQFQINDSKAQSIYTNFCRVTGTPEELIIDFGLNSQPYGTPTEPIVITQRVITNYFTAKRLLQVLQMTLERHESAFGALETDVQRRVKRT
jgi:hypothetical protein